MIPQPESREMLDAIEYRWYQADPILSTGETIGGARLIAPSKLSALARAWRYVPEGFAWLVTGSEVNEVPDSILSEYNLNRIEDYNAFLEQRRG